MRKQLSLTWILCILATIPVAVFAQRKDTLITISLRQATYREFFQKITEQTGLQFSYTSAFNVNEQINGSLVFKNNKLRDVLYVILKKKKKVSYRVIGNTIYIGSAPVSSNQQSNLLNVNAINVSGIVTDTAGQPLIGATIRVNDGSKPFRGTSTNEKGKFAIDNIDKNATLTVSYTGFNSEEIAIPLSNFISVRLGMASIGIGTVEVLSTGYQNIPPERATGSFVSVNNELINRRVSTNILDRIDGVASGVLFNSNSNKKGNDPPFSIRGRSTIFAETKPLIVVDNFPYDGDLSNINPNDVQTITILKDAAAASIWGARAGNGVIVITTKKGKQGSAPRISFNSNLTISAPLNIYYEPQLSSAQFIEVEKFLYDKDFYQFALSNPVSPVSDAVLIFDKLKKGILNQQQADQQLNGLAQNDVRKQIQKYYLRKAINQQYSISISGGNDSQVYYASLGYDKNLSSLKSDQYSRLSLNINNTHYLLKKKLEVTTGVLLTKTNTSTGTGIYSPYQPYVRLVDDNGNPLSVNNTRRNTLMDTLGKGKLLDWSYKPINELDNGISNQSVLDYRINLTIKYNLTKALALTGSYQYGSGNYSQNATFSSSSFFTRDLINSFSFIDPVTQVVDRPIPLGAITNDEVSKYQLHYTRLQANYNRTVNQGDEINLIGGFEIKQNVQKISGFRQYGVNMDLGKTVPVDYVNLYPLFLGGAARIPNIDRIRELDDRFISFYFNGSYTFRNRYTLSVSARKDESNLFGVNTNKKGVPLWSIGGSWTISDEPFFKLPMLPYLKIRLTNGYNGNIDRSLTAFTTARLSPSPTFYGDPYSLIVNPPNPDLSWEKIHVVNFGIDFSLKKERVSGTIEYYIKNGKDLLGGAPMAPQTGIVEFKGNNSAVRTSGLDITLNTKNINRDLKWNTVFLFSILKDKITSYKVKSQNTLNLNGENPVEGKPYSSIFAFKWRGLDENGDPLGFLNGKVLKDYATIISNSTTEDLSYVGPATAQYFGSIRNTFSYKNVELSINIIYKLGYFYRKSVLQSTGLYDFNGGAYKQPDYEKRWQKPGDEMHTSVPALRYPFDPNRDAFYSHSEASVEKGDHIRLQDVQISYQIKPKSKFKYFQGIKLYTYANNLGILWRANKSKIDPDVIYATPNPRTFSFGIKADF